MVDIDNAVADGVADMEVDKNSQRSYNSYKSEKSQRIESLGAWHPSAITELKRIGSALARHTGEEEGVTISRLFQRLSVCLMRGNAALFNNRCPPEQLPSNNELEW